MKQHIKNIVKNNKFIYSLYYYVFSFILRCIGLFVKTNKNLVIFVCYGGRRYDDSTRFLYEYLKSKDKYKNLKMVGLLLI